jgi:hypothetical protein
MEYRTRHINAAKCILQEILLKHNLMRISVMYYDCTLECVAEDARCRIYRDGTLITNMKTQQT